MKRREFCASALAMSAATAVNAQGGPVEGRDYTKIGTPVAVNAAPGKIDVLEFFSYACPHCAALEPQLQPWTAKLPPDVTFRRMPVGFLYNAENFQRLYFTLEVLGAVEPAHARVFTAIHVDHKRLEKPEDMAAFVGTLGVDPSKFMATFKSFAVQTRLQQAKQAMAAFGIQSVPTMAVQGRFTATAGQGGRDNLLAVTDFMIQRVRSKA